MLRLSADRYALMAMKHLLFMDRGASSAREIAEQYDIPAELMAKVLQRLVRRGLLVSHQGTRGGYQLARPATLMSVADVIPGRRRPAHGHRLLDRRSRLRPVHEVQRPRPALAHQGPHPHGPRSLHACRNRRRHQRADHAGHALAPHRRGRHRTLNHTGATRSAFARPRRQASPVRPSASTCAGVQRSAFDVRQQ